MRRALVRVCLTVLILSFSPILSPKPAWSQTHRELTDLQFLPEEYLLKSFEGAMDCDNYGSQIRFSIDQADWLMPPNTFYLYSVLSKTEFFYLLELGNTDYRIPRHKLYFERTVRDLKRPHRVSEAEWKEKLARLAPNASRNIFQYTSADNSGATDDCRGEHE